jgi:transposase
MIDDKTRAEVRRLFFAEHWKIGTIAVQHGLHHRTVKAALGLVDPPLSGGTLRPTKLDPYVPFIQDILSRYPNLVATRVADMVRERGYVGNDSSVRRCIQRFGLRPRKQKEAFFRLTTLPGEQGQVDWAHFGRVPVEGGQRALYCFVMTLSWSRATYAEFFLDQTLQSFVTGFVHAVEAFGGTPRAVLTDNLKSVVLERQGDAIRFHPRILEMCGEYLTIMQPCAPRRGNEKGRVERRIRDLRTSFWPARRFRDVADLNEQVCTWIRDIAHRREVPGDPQRRRIDAAFEEERGHLLALPLHPFDTGKSLGVTATKQPYVRFDANQYSVPHSLVDRPLTLHATTDVVRLLHENAEVARHQRCWGLHQIIEEPAHLDGLADYKRKARESRDRNHLSSAVPGVQALMEHLARHGEVLGTATQRLWRLLDEYGPVELSAALAEVMTTTNPSIGSVAYLLEKRRRAAGRKLADPIHVPDRPEINNLRVDFAKLEAYDDL